MGGEKGGKVHTIPLMSTPLTHALPTLTRRPGISDTRDRERELGVGGGGGGGGREKGGGGWVEEV